MADIPEADRFLIAQIRGGNADGWTQLVTRYQGRLLAFARSRLGRKSEAEDFVQDTFVAFLQNIRTFNEQLSLETYLFTILRRRLIDAFRGRKLRACFLQDRMHGKSEDDSSVADMLPSRDMSASWYARRDEELDRRRDLLAEALWAYVERLRGEENFRDLKIIELLFFAQMRNKDIGPMVGLDEKQIALIKHRAIKEIRETLASLSDVGGADALANDVGEGASEAGSILTDVWENQRPTCPKRSTLGRHLLGSLEEPWRGYVEFHVNALGCSFCKANVDDLQKQTDQSPKGLSEKVFESTIGFFNRPQ